MQVYTRRMRGVCDLFPVYISDVFDSCGAAGPTGPTQEMCRTAYGPNHTVHVIEDGSWRGAQLWTVPLTSTYRLFASKREELYEER